MGPAGNASMVKPTTWELSRPRTPFGLSRPTFTTSVAGASPCPLAARRRIEKVEPMRFSDRTAICRTRSRVSAPLQEQLGLIGQAQTSRPTWTDMRTRVAVPGRAALIRYNG